jgi:hypothetical protein
MACGNNEVSGEALASQPSPLAHPGSASPVDPEPTVDPPTSKRMIQSAQVWTTEDPERPERLDVYITTSGAFEPAAEPDRYEFRGTGYRELAKAIFENDPKAEQPPPVRLGEKQYTHLVGHIERDGENEYLILNPEGPNTGLIRGSGVAGGEIRGWNPQQDNSDEQA